SASCMKGSENGSTRELIAALPALRRGRGAARALAAQEDVVGVDGVVDALGERVDGLLEPLVLERRHLAAAVAGDGVGVLAARVGGLEARRPVADVQALQEPETVHQLERAVDAGEPRAGAAALQLVGDLAGREAAALAREHLDDGEACAAPAVSRALQPGACVVVPVFGPGHVENDTQNRQVRWWPVCVCFAPECLASACCRWPPCWRSPPRPAAPRARPARLRRRS